MLDCASRLRPSGFWRSRHKLFIRWRDKQQRVGPICDDDGSPKNPSPVIAGKKGRDTQDAREADGHNRQAWRRVDRWRDSRSGGCDGSCRAGRGAGTGG